MRLFAAIAAEGAVRETLVQAQAELRRLGRGGFPRPEMLHLTLAFLGEVPSDAPARAALETLRGTGPLVLTAEGVGRFGDTWWAGIRPDRELEARVLGLQAELRRRGMAVEDRPWVPHITLARHYRPKSGMPELCLPPVPMEVRQVVLLESLRQEGRAVYVLRHAAEL